LLLVSRTQFRSCFKRNTKLSLPSSCKATQTKPSKGITRFMSSKETERVLLVFKRKLLPRLFKRSLRRATLS